MADENKVKLSKIAKSIRGFTIKTAVGIIILMPSLVIAQPFKLGAIRHAASGN